MSFAKFYHFIETASLWFANQERLATDDPFEGVFPRGNYLHREWKEFSDVPVELKAAIRGNRYTGKAEADETEQDKLIGEKEIRDLRIRQAFLYRKAYFVNCWCCSPGESNAMWRIYGAENNSVAVVSNLERLKVALGAASESIFCGAVSYLD